MQRPQKMQQELKHLYTQDFKQITMKTILTLITTVICLFAATNQLKAQNLQFNSAVFNEYGPVSTTAATVPSDVYTGTLVVGANQVLKITGASVSRITGPNGAGYIRINGNVLSYSPVEWYLPSGSYEITFTNVSLSIGGDVSALITGVLYDIVP